ncbi:MAG: hypothetical protein QXS02_00255 [Candidatus Thermoplasmatota archaeon]
MSTLIIRSKTKKGLIIFGAIVVIILLLALGFYAAVELLKEKKTGEEEPGIERIRDDRISPLENQGVIIEVKRIRHRGLLDTIMNKLVAWRFKPSFYFITIMDDLEYVSKDVRAATGESEQLYTTWDTMFMENKIVRDVPGEQEKSEITLIIMERVKTGLFKLRKNDVERETIKIVYDYRTGRWNGDDYFNDSDGYGHYLGEYFEVWFNVYQIDYDHDGIPYWTEVNILGTDPTVDDSKLDPDDDGIPTAWEWRWGYNPFTYDNHSLLDPDHDGLTNIQEYQMEKWFADPFYKDIYIEVDGMQKKNPIGRTYVFWKESQQILIERFASHGISVFIDDGWPDGPVNGGGELLPYYETISQDSGMMLQFYRHNFADERKGMFRYLLIANSAGFCHPSEYNRYDTMAVGTARSIMLKRGGFTPRAERILLAAMVMHELGHSLGIAPWNTPGNDNASFTESKAAKQDYLEKWGNYKSVMNYYYIYDKKLVDYSDGSHGEGDQNDWEKFDLTLFKKECKVIEDPGFTLPGKEEV